MNSLCAAGLDRVYWTFSEGGVFVHPALESATTITNNKIMLGKIVVTFFNHCLLKKPWVQENPDGRLPFVFPIQKPEDEISRWQSDG